MIRSFITFTLSIIVALVVGGLLMAPYLSWKHGSYPQSYPLDETEEAIENENATSSTAYPDGEVIFFGPGDHYLSNETLTDKNIHLMKNARVYLLDYVRIDNSHIRVDTNAHFIVKSRNVAVVSNRIYGSSTSPVMATYFADEGIRLTRDSLNTTIVTQNAGEARPWRSRLQEPGALKLQSVPPYVDTLHLLYLSAYLPWWNTLTSAMMVETSQLVAL